MRFLTFFLVLISGPLMADFSIFYSSGGQLIPVKETDIEMQKEVLYLKRVPGGFEVNVYFEFFNPGDARDETAGFVTPPSRTYEPITNKDDFDNKHPYIDNFAVEVNGEILPFKVSALESTGFSLQFMESTGVDVIYYMKMHFEPGLNKVRTRYIFRGSEYKGQYLFEYRLTTGKMWAKDAIGDFELIIESPNTYLDVPMTFQKNNEAVNWQLLGIGRLADANAGYGGNVYLRSGFLRCHMMDFKPDYDLSFGIPTTFDQVKDLTIADMDLELSDNLLDIFLFSIEERINDSSFITPVGELSNEWIQILINFFYAVHGYKIANPGAEAIFKKAPWYLPDPSVKASKIQFGKKEGIIFNTLIKERSRRK